MSVFLPRVRAVASGMALAAAILLAGPALAGSGFRPAEAEGTLSSLKYQCLIEALCPLSAGNYESLRGAIAGKRRDQFLIGLSLLRGDGAPLDRKAGTEWIVQAAEAGMPYAVEWVDNQMRNGADIEIDEKKMAAALKRQADSGDIQSMLVLAPMMMRGRGVDQDPAAGIEMLRRAGDKSQDGETAYKIAELFLVGTNGMVRDHEEAMRWYAIAASRGHVFSMATLGGLWENRPLADVIDALKNPQMSPRATFEPDVVQSYCWRVRASLMDSKLAQYELALMRSRSVSDNRGNVLQPDLVEADVWFRLGARDPEYDNSQLRAAIEPKMTTAQLDEARKRVAAFHALDFERMKASKIPVPGQADRTCPPMP
ncbi:MAG: sel1 repeat family protein [Alphaproteobacteria bacterium]|nr:sel1 repeat family protein [Alphaproteobacteria bacterium]